MDKPSETPETIYLIPDSEHGHVWCDDPAPGLGMDPEDAIGYRRLDTADTELAAAKARIAELEKALEPFAGEARKGLNYDSTCPVDLAQVFSITVGDLRRAAALLKEKE